MKKIMSLLLSIIMMVSIPSMTAFAKPDWPADTGIQSEAGIVMDMDSGAVLFGQNIHVQKAPASITKVLTALVVVENADLDDTVTFSDDAVNNVEEASGNKEDIAPGDKMTVRDCLHFLLLTSSNQAANALAEHVAGSREAFVEMMNRKAGELGCQESHFANPSGLNDDTHLTSVYDMALIGKAAYENPTLLEINSTKRYQLPPTANRPSGATITAEHQMLDSSKQYYYEAAVAGKTGYTFIAGQTLITYAVKDDRRLIAVTMKSTEFTHYSDTIALMDFGFNRFENISIAENETGYTSGDQPVELAGQSYEPSDLSIDPAAAVTVPREASFTDAEKTVTTELPEDYPDGAVALLSYSYHDRKIGEAYLISASKAAADASATAGNDENDTQAATPPEGERDEGGREASGKPKFSFRLPKQAGLLALVAVLGAAAVGLGVFFVRRRREEERRRMEERRKRRRQRLEEIGCTEEEFERLLEKRNRRGGKE